MAVDWTVEQAMLKLGKPSLKPELVVFIVVGAFQSSVFKLTVEIA